MIYQYIYNHYRRLSIIIIALLSLTSCTEDIKLDTDNAAPVLVIYGVITDEIAYQEIHLSASGGYFEGQKNPKISNATVSISSDNGETYQLQEVANEPGTYRTTTQIAGKPGKTYYLKVTTDFNKDGTPDIYEAEAKMETKVELDSMDISYEKIANYHYYSFNIYAQEPVGDNYYMCRYIINDSVYNQISKYIIFDDLSFDNQYIKGTSIGYFYDESERDKYVDDNDYEQMVFVADGDAVKLELSNINKGYYNFLKQCQDEKDGESPFFGGPLSNITTNIKGGGIGYFAARSISKATSIAKKEEAQ
nr:DUF4249 domain-containing protein [uncultured Bacteroides sp.]